MAVVVEISLASGDRTLSRVLDELSPIAWAFELYERAPRAILLALIPEHDPARAREQVAGAIDALHLGEAISIQTRAKLPDSWVGWRERARMVQVGPVWIASPSVAAGQHHGRVLAIESKNAFGSGLHDTTLLCLERILELSPASELLDVGAGSGILSLTAIALGAPRAIGVEIDPAAVAIANETARRNRCADRFFATTVSADKIGRKFPFVVANIIARVLVELTGQIAPCVDQGGRLLLCGMRTADVEEVAACYTSRGLRRVGEAERGGWVRLELERPR